ncbi:MAG: arginine--tRNA ligase [Nitrospirales bacterium]|nr:arginine--tRNA ligase [Nitrospira sp.]MDR4500111.1 arginine--tRNA ligase [Nitrospirales bacterium]
MKRRPIQEQVVEALSVALSQAVDNGELSLTDQPVPTIELPKREEWGDLSSNIAMLAAPKAKRPPMEIAGLLASSIKTAREDLFDRVDVAPPGFLNFTINPHRWTEVLPIIEELGPAYGSSQIGKGQRVILEFVSANPTGPLHVGHGRGAALGQAAANLLETVGYRVQREYYINDAGRQLHLLGLSVYSRYQEFYGRTVTFPEDGYHGTYIRSVAESMAKEYGESLLDLDPREAERRAAEFACSKLLGRIKDDLGVFGVEFHEWYSEAGLIAGGHLEQALEDLKQRNLIFQDEGAWWFKSSAFQDEKDRVVAKQDGSYTYLASDIAYHRNKFSRGFETIINIWGADHHGYIPRMQAAVQAFGYHKEQFRVVLVQMVNLLRGGTKVEMSKRAGEFVTLREVIDEVGADAAKFFFLMRRADSHLDFDLELAKQQSSDNPVYYVQYAHARLASLFRVAESRGFQVQSVEHVDMSLVMTHDELRLIKCLSRYPGVVEGSAMNLEPHRMTFYLQELAALLHTYYNKHRILPPLALDSELSEDASRDSESSESEPEMPQSGSGEVITPELTAARLAMMRQVQTVLRNGLAVLGISAPEQM